MKELVSDEKLILPLIPNDFKNTPKKRYSITQRLLKEAIFSSIKIV